MVDGLVDLQARSRPSPCRQRIRWDLVRIPLEARILHDIATAGRRDIVAPRRAPGYSSFGSATILFGTTTLSLMALSQLRPAAARNTRMAGSAEPGSDSARSASMALGVGSSGPGFPPAPQQDRRDGGREGRGSNQIPSIAGAPKMREKPCTMDLQVNSRPSAVAPGQSAEHAERIFVFASWPGPPWVGRRPLSVTWANVRDHDVRLDMRAARMDRVTAPQRSVPQQRRPPVTKTARCPTADSRYWGSQRPALARLRLSSMPERESRRVTRSSCAAAHALTWHARHGQ
jgi:hypothetical protein